MGTQTSKNQQRQRPQLKVDERKKLVMIGDSTLDNIAWVGGYQNCIKSALQKLNADKCVVNLAADGFTSNDVLAGSSSYLISYTHRKNLDPYPILENESFKPLEIYSTLNNIGYTILSIGGNDIRCILSDMAGLQKATEKYLMNYHKICSILLKKSPNLVLMLQYKPSISQNGYNIYEHLSKLPLPGTPLQKMNHIMQNIYPKIFQLAKQYNLPLIDLPNTFNPEDETLYVSQIQPSKKGGQIIASLITSTINNHEYKKSLFYSLKNGELKIYENVSNWKASR